MAKIILDSDTSSHGGKMISSTGLFTAEGKNVCVTGDMHQCPRSGHGNTPVTGRGTVLSNGRGLILEGDVAGCGAVMVSSSSTNTDAD